MKRFFIERILHEYGSMLPKNRIYFAHIFGGALIFLTFRCPNVSCFSTTIPTISYSGNRNTVQNIGKYRKPPRKPNSLSSSWGSLLRVSAQHFFDLQPPIYRILIPFHLCYSITEWMRYSFLAILRFVDYPGDLLYLINRILEIHDDKFKEVNWPYLLQSSHRWYIWFLVYSFCNAWIIC